MTKEEDIINLIIEGIQERKGRGITLVDMKKVDGATIDGFVICQGNTPMQVTAIADSVREYLQKEAGIKPYNYDGYRNAQWIVIDYGEILVHVFTPDTRQYYNLEELWSDADITAVPDLD